MENDFISRTEAIGTIEAFFCLRCPDFLRCNHECEIAELMLEFEKIRREDVRENVHGHWTNVNISVTGESSAECSNCGAVVHDDFCAVIKYCPSCGAMLGGESNA